MWLSASDAAVYHYIMRMVNKMDAFLEVLLYCVGILDVHCCTNDRDVSFLAFVLLFTDSGLCF